jgi:hypothetical protein
VGLVQFRVTVQVKHQDGTPASFAVLNLFRHARVCFLWWCWDVDNFAYRVMTDFYGTTTVLLDKGSWHLRADLRGAKSGDWIGDVNSNGGLIMYVVP